MRSHLWALLLLFSLAALPAWAQETRGNISGTVTDSTGVVPGAAVKVTNVSTGVSQTLTTNANGFYNAPLLNPGSYQVSVEMAGYKTLTRSGITLSVGQQVAINLGLEVGAVTEQVTVLGEAPLLDTNTVTSAQNFDRKTLETIPLFSNTPALLLRYAPGVTATDAPQYIGQGYVAAGSTQVTPLGGVGAVEWTIDGATNGGSDRRQAQMPTTDMVEEVRVESGNFDASQGHGTGLQISMMTRAGTNAWKGSGDYQHWTNTLNAMNASQKTTFASSPETGAAWKKGRSHQFVGTFGGPLSIPKVVDGHNKLFFFGSYSTSNETIPGRNQPTVTVPSAKHLSGDFSDLLLLPSPTQYIIYDPLTVRPDPARPGKFIRDAFPNNIIPKDRFMNPDGTYKNPLFGLYQAMVPNPNQNFISTTQAPTNNYYEGAQPNLNTYTQGALRIDDNLSQHDRLYLRTSLSRYYESLFDWTYQSRDPSFHNLHADDMKRHTWAYEGDWTHTAGSTVIDTQVAANQYGEHNYYYKEHTYKPSDVGLPSYLDTFCATAGDCKLPVVNISGYQGISNAAGSGLDTTNIQAQSTLTKVMGAHTVRSGIDIRQARRFDPAAGNPSGTYTFDNTYTKAADTTVDFPSTTTGPSLAAFMLGIPTTVSVSQNSSDFLTNMYTAGFFQDNWRVSRSLTINAGLRYEYENGIKEKSGNMLVGFDPTATNSITALAAAAYAKNPIPQLAVSDFQALGAAVYAPNANATTWKGQSMYEPRLGATYKLTDKTVVKGGWGLYYDTLNATASSINNTGYSVTTSNSASTDFGQTWLLGDPKNGVSPLSNPFPVRLTGSRFETPLGNSLGGDILLGSAYTPENTNREHPRVQRVRFGVQRELIKNTSVEVAYDGAFGDRLGFTLAQSYVPEQYYATGNVRDTTQQTLMQGNVTNPYNINNFASLQTTNPALYQRMAGNAFFTATTIQRQFLIRQFSDYGTGNGVQYGNLPLGKNKTHSLSVNVQRRYSHGVSGNFAYTYTHSEDLTSVETYERTPTLWQPSNNARPQRITAGGNWELPFGDSRRFLNKGGVLAAVVGGWQMSGTFEYQPGGLLNWGNLFFYGNLSDIALAHPTLNEWFNTDAGFEKDPAKVPPTSFQKRSFPFRVDGVRGYTLADVNLSLLRNIPAGKGRTISLRLNAQNLLNRQGWGNPNLTPTSTQFGMITSPSGQAMRFVTFVSKISF